MLSCAAWYKISSEGLDAALNRLSSSSLGAERLLSVLERLNAA